MRYKEVKTMNLLDKIILKLYLWKFPQKPLEQKPETIFPEPQIIPIKTIHGVCWYPERAVVNGIANKERICRSLVESMIQELAECLGSTITMENQDEFGTLRIQGTLDVVIDNNNFKFGD